MARTKGAISRNVTQTTARYRIWRAIRMLRRFSIPEIIATAEATRSNAQKYLLGLEKAGYLRVVRPRLSGVKMGSTVYQLAIDSGPNPPRLGVSGVFDPNIKG